MGAKRLVAVQLLLFTVGWKTWESTWQTKDIDPGSLKKVVSSAFDPFGRPATITPPDDPGHVVNLSYTGERLTTKTVRIATGATEQSVVTSTEQYDAMGRLYKLKQPSGTAGAEVTTTYTYDVAGRLIKAVNPAQVRSWSYDGRGFLVSESVPEKGTNTTNGTVTYSSYNVRGQATRVIDGGSDLTSTYDDAGRLLTISETATPTNVLRSLSYGTGNSTDNLAKGKLVTAATVDGASGFQTLEILTYGGVDGRISRRATVAGATYTNTFNLDLTWSPLGNVASVTYPQIAGIGPARTVTNVYDNGRLTKVAQGETDYASEISYHSNGAINRVTYGNQVWVEHAKDPDDMSRPRRITMGNAGEPWTTGEYLYDGAGNIKAMGADTFRYDKVNRLVEANVGSYTQSYTYDPYGNLTLISTDGVDRTIAVVTASNRVSGAGYERDHRSPEANDDLDYMHARYYNPYLGRFLSVDPVGGSIDSSQSWNRYSYVQNNPLILVDPNGLLERDANGAPVYEVVSSLGVRSAGRSRRWQGYRFGVERVNLFTTKGRLIESTSVRQLSVGETNAGKIVSPTGQITIDQTSANPMFTNCHGSVFADGLFAIDNAEVSKILQDDYTAVQDGESQIGDVVVFYGESGVVHSATVTSVDEAGNPALVSSVSGIDTTAKQTDVEDAWEDDSATMKVFRENERD
jgi:RHS repeat-associated protein